MIINKVLVKKTEQKRNIGNKEAQGKEMVLRKKVQMETQQENPIDTNEHIRITRLHTDKTRKTNEADVRYHVFFHK